MQQNQPYHSFPRKNKKLVAPLFWIVGILLTASCAIVRPPEGGLKDETAPKIISTSPHHQSKYVDNQNIVITLDEYIDPNFSASDVIITPLPEVPPQVFVQGKTIHIKLQETLLPNTTYSVMLKPAVKDFHERNAIQEPFQLAFSTGANLDSAGIQGVVVDALSSKPDKNCMVALFSPENVPDSNFTGVKPKYIAITDSTGRFSLNYVTPGTYFRAAFSDADNSNTYNSSTEKIGLTEHCIVKITNDSTPKVTFLTQIWDTFPPSVSKVRWLGKTSLEVLFSEGLQEIPVVKSPAGVTTTAWIGQNGKAIQLFRPAGMPGDSIVLSQVTDSSGNTATKVILMPVTPPPDTFWMEQKPHPEKLNTWLLRTNEIIPFDSFQTHCFCLDTANKKIPLQVESSNGVIEWTHPPNLNPETQIRIVLQPFKSEYAKMDTAQTLYCFPRFAESYGSVTGKVEGAGSVVVFLLKEGSQSPIAISTVSEFSFNLLDPGSYQLQIVSDDDHNKTRTMGGLRPYRLPEKVWKLAEPVLVKANWETNVGVLKPVFTH